MNTTAYLFVNPDKKSNKVYTHPVDFTSSKFKRMVDLYIENNTSDCGFIVHRDGNAMYYSIVISYFHKQILGLCLVTTDIEIEYSSYSKILFKSLNHINKLYFNYNDSEAELGFPSDFFIKEDTITSINKKYYVPIEKVIIEIFQSYNINYKQLPKERLSISKDKYSYFNEYCHEASLSCIQNGFTIICVDYFFKSKKDIRLKKWKTEYEKCNDFESFQKYLETYENNKNAFQNPYISQAKATLKSLSEKFKILTISCPGVWTNTDSVIFVYLNDVFLGRFSSKKGFTLNKQITERTNTLSIRTCHANKLSQPQEYTFETGKDKNYICVISRSKRGNNFNFSINSGIEIYRNGAESSAKKDKKNLSFFGKLWSILKE